MNKWVIFSDVDGTIYPFPNKELSNEIINKTKELSEKNIPFVINTGNGPYEKIQRLANELSGRYIICSNGALIFDNLEKRILNIEYMPHKEVEKVWQISDKLGIGLYYFGTHQYYLKDFSKENTDFLTRFCEYDQWNTEGKINQDIHKIEVYGNRDEIERFYQEISKIDIDLNVCNLKTHIEITKTGVSKASGIKWLCDNVFNCNLEDVMAIGDSPNDISMLEAVGYSYVMDNADPETKKAAKYYTSDVRQNGLAEAIDDYLYRSDYELKRMISQQKSKK